MIGRFLLLAWVIALSGCDKLSTPIEHRACADFFEDRFGARMPVAMSSFQTLDDPITSSELRRQFYPDRLTEMEQLHFAAFANRRLGLRTVWFNGQTGVRPGGIVELQGFMCKFVLVDGELYRRDSLLEGARRTASQLKMSEMTAALGDRELNRRMGDLVRDRELAHECCLP